MFKFRRKGKRGGVDEKRLAGIIQEELNAYIKQEDLQSYLDKIERDKEKKRIWDLLTARKKIKVLHYYVTKQKGVKYGK